MTQFQKWKCLFTPETATRFHKFFRGHNILLMKYSQIIPMKFPGFTIASNVLYSYELIRIWRINPLIDALGGDTRLQQHKLEHHTHSHQTQWKYF